MSKLHLLDITVILVYLVICLIIGFMVSKKIKSIKDYALGGDYTPTPVLVATLFATDIGAEMTVGSVEKVYSMGLIFTAAIMFRPLFWLAASAIFGNHISRFRQAGCLSLSDVMGMLYGNTARWVTNFMAMVGATGALTMQIIAMGYLFHYFLDVPPMQTALISFGVLVTYSFCGGMRAVALTDVLQGSIFFIGIPLACYLAHRDLGMSAPQIFHLLPASHHSFSFLQSHWWLFLTLVIDPLSSISEGPLVQRFLMARSTKQLKKVLKACFFLSLFFTIVMVLIAHVIMIKAPNINPNLALFYLVDMYLPIGVKGLLVAGLLAAIMSTADSWLNTASVIFSHDVLKKLIPWLSSKQELLSARLFLLLLSAMVSALALSTNQALRDIGWMMSNFWGPIIGVPIIIGLLTTRASQKIFMGAAVVGMIGVFVGYRISGQLATVSSIVGMIGSIIGWFTTRYFLEPCSDEVPDEIRGLSLPSPGGASSGWLNHPWTNLLPHPVMFLRGLPNRSKELMSQQGDFYYVAGVVGAIQLLGMFFSTTIQHTPMMLGLYAMSVIGCFSLLVHELIFSRAWRERYMPLYFYMVLFVLFALAPAYNLVLSGYAAPWVLNLGFSVLVLHFMGGFRLCVLFSLLGMLASLVLYEIAKEPSMKAQDLPDIYYLALCFSCMIFAAKHKDVLQKVAADRREHWTKMMAHQVMQPITHMSLASDYLRLLLAGYTTPTVEQDGKSYMLVEAATLRKVGQIGRDLKKSSRTSDVSIHGLIDMMSTDMEHAQDVDVYDMRACVMEALSIYSTEEQNRILVHPEGTFTMRISKLLMVEVLRNLVSNSLAYAGKDASIEIYFKPTTLHVWDNGVGIDEEAVSRIFELKPPHEPGHGMGLGLVFCKGIMNAFGFDMLCHSEKGKYTEFILQFET